ncbi:RNA polymerase sigma factor [Herbaspirillum seropedicae]|uniref:RNA polymerase sigma-70 factor, ECF subfamily (Sigma-24) transcription regulator protein n=2 Tax=Herbaspirillum seropedicae TaxID=964 RepID=D8IWU3_HERSS|nr:RNA polymerase sigma-70 factor, ECF subfamily (sigma-24) transcription regulator protein [Herbaspirillum seropedicae SmR1]AKN67756.1 RNA polymerase sigma factor [Herbaspirillum seropedicae]NQE29795.1 RNA polymerase sigma factor [Herbaspirillum seropedicae]
MPAMEELHVDPLETLYRDHHGWLRAWLRRKLGCTEQAADLAHDTFLRLLATRDVLSALKEPRAYLVTAARHLLIDRSRRQQIRQAYLDQLERQFGACPELMHAPSAETILQAVQAIEALGRALQAARAEAAEAFILHYVQGRRQEELASHFNVSLRTVQGWLAQALIQCHRHLAAPGA